MEQVKRVKQGNSYIRVYAYVDGYDSTNIPVTESAGEALGRIFYEQKLDYSLILKVQVKDGSVATYPLVSFIYDESAGRKYKVVIGPKAQPVTPWIAFSPGTTSITITLQSKYTDSSQVNSSAVVAALTSAASVQPGVAVLSTLTRPAVTAAFNDGARAISTFVSKDLAVQYSDLINFQSTATGAPIQGVTFSFAAGGKATHVTLIAVDSYSALYDLPAPDMPRYGPSPEDITAKVKYDSDPSSTGSIFETTKSHLNTWSNFWSPSTAAIFQASCKPLQDFLIGSVNLAYFDRIAVEYALLAQQSKFTTAEDYWNQRDFCLADDVDAAAKHLDLHLKFVGSASPATHQENRLAAMKGIQTAISSPDPRVLQLFCSPEVTIEDDTNELFSMGGARSINIDADKVGKARLFVPKGATCPFNELSAHPDTWNVVLDGNGKYYSMDLTFDARDQVKSLTVKTLSGAELQTIETSRQCKATG